MFFGISSRSQVSGYRTIGPLVSAPEVAVNVKPCILIVLDIPFKRTSLPGALSLYFTFLIILPDAGAISTSASFLSHVVAHIPSQDEPAPVKQTSLGKVCIPVNPVSSPSPAIIISQEPLSCRNGLLVKSYMLHLSVTCRLQQKVPNGLCNGDVSDIGMYSCLVQS